jgi:WD40 repeat protein/serine/threonine protein kinase/class 3 adenylate cyclase
MVIMFTDLIDSTAWKVRIGDHEYVEHVARPHNQIFRELLKAYPGANERCYTGDGFMATFVSVADAVTCALSFHRALNDGNWKRGVPKTRVGIHIGDTIEFPGNSGETNLASHAADMTARLMSMGEGGQTLMTRAAFDSARQSVQPTHIAEITEDELEWLAHGNYHFKGSDEAMEVFEVGVRGKSPLRAPVDSDKTKRVVNDEELPTLGWRPAIGKEIPQRAGWHITLKLGQGGFGEVWLAEQERTKELRAFKFCFDSDRLRSFKRELTFFKLIRRELGPRQDIASLLDVQLDEPPFFLEAEYFPNGNLCQWANSRGGIEKIPLSFRLQLVALVARAVGAAHSLGIIHKDLKPSNILIAETAQGPKPRVSDFGIGTLTDRTLLNQSGVTATGFTESLFLENDSSRTGTRLYAPPESLIGKAATTAGDVYALGVILYQLVTADLDRPLATGWEEDVSDSILREDIRACTHRNTERRLFSAILLAELLETIEQRRAARLASERALQQAKRLRILKTALAFSIVGFLIIGGLALTTFIQKRRAEMALDYAERNLYANKMSSIERAWDENYVDEGIALLDQQIPAHGRSDLRGFEWYLWNRRFRPGFVNLPGTDPINLSFSPWGPAAELIRTIVFSPDGQLIASVGTNREATIWNSARGDGRIAFHGPTNVAALAFSSDGNHLLSTGEDGTVTVWDVRTKAARQTFGGFTNNLSAIAFSADGEQVVFGASDNSVTIRAVTTGEELSKLRSRTPGVCSVGLSPNRKWLTVATCATNHVIELWNRETGKLVSILNGHRNVIEGLRFSSDSSRFVSTDFDGVAKIWEISSATEIATFSNSKLSGARGSPFAKAAAVFSPEGRYLAYAGESTITVRDLKRKRDLLTVKGLDACAFAFSPDGARLAVACDRDGSRLRVYDVQNVCEPTEIDGNGSLAFDRNSTRLAFGTKGGSIQLWDCRNKHLLNSFKGTDGIFQRVQFSPDGSRLATERSRRDGVTIWDAGAGAELKTFARPTNRVNAFTFGANKNEIITAWENEVTAWNVNTGERLFTLTGQTNAVSELAYTSVRGLFGSLDSKHFAKIWDRTTLKVVQTFSNYWGAITFSPDGNYVAASGDTIGIWDLRTGTEISTLTSFGPWGASSLAFSPDSQRLVSAHGDGTVKVWDFRGGHLLMTLEGHNASLLTVAFSPDGKRLASAGQTEPILIWNVH